MDSVTLVPGFQNEFFEAPARRRSHEVVGRCLEVHDEQLVDQLHRKHHCQSSPQFTAKTRAFRHNSDDLSQKIQPVRPENAGILDRAFAECEPAKGVLEQATDHLRRDVKRVLDSITDRSDQRGRFLGFESLLSFHALAHVLLQSRPFDIL